MCVVDLFSKYAIVVPLKDKTGINVVNEFQKIMSKGDKPNKIWVDQGGEFYNKLFKGFLKKQKQKNIEMYSTFIKGKSVVGERFVKTLRKKIFKI